MNIRQAILAAADHIEGNPADFNFFKIDVPDSCGTPGCALGWIGHFLRVKPAYRVAITMDVARAMGFPPQETLPEYGDTTVFYDRMDVVSDGIWRLDFAKCAAALRAYADKFHPADRNFARELTARLASLPEISEEVQS